MPKPSRLTWLVAAIFFAALACSTRTPSTTATPGASATPTAPAAATPATATQTPTPTPKPTLEPSPLPPAYTYDVVQVPEGSFLIAYANPDAAGATAGSIPANTVGLIPTGRASTVGSMVWVEINIPGGGIGWVYRNRLTEHVDPAAFCADARVPELFSKLLAVFEGNDSSLFGPIISPVHGLTVTYIHNGNSRVYYPTVDTGILESTEVVNWGNGPGSGLPVEGTFFDLVRPDLVQVLSSGYEARCGEIVLGGASYEVTWPFEWQNIRYYSLYKPGAAGHELEWMTWLTGVEYVDGAPYLYSLNRYNWEP
jgi:hypothetical protein